MATTSDVKFAQYSVIFESLGINVRRATAVTSVLIEPQFDPAHDNPEGSIVGHPLRQAARFAEKAGIVPYVIEDTMLVVSALSKDFRPGSGLPGADTKNWWRNLGAEGLLRLLVGIDDRRAKFICQLGAYVGRRQYVFERAELAGTISQSPRVSERAQHEVPYSNPHYFHCIFQPDGCDATLGEMCGAEFASVDYRRKCAIQFARRLADLGVGADPQLNLPF